MLTLIVCAMTFSINYVNATKRKHPDQETAQAVEPTTICHTCSQSIEPKQSISLPTCCKKRIHLECAEKHQSECKEKHLAQPNHKLRRF